MMKNIASPYISQNPYRIIGVLSNSGIKEIHKNLSKLKAYAQLGKGKTSKDKLLEDQSLDNLLDNYVVEII